ncbi:hypothetical protein KGY64_05800 [Candidatus Bipolaricaulota bacterium]|nr:hypothetical protein [Candidatus Bipolaricaulota bacterium]
MLCSKRRYLVLAIVSLSLIFVGVSAPALDAREEDTQTPSKRMAEGVFEALEANFADMEVENGQTDSLMADSKRLIDAGVPPGTLVSITNAVKAGVLGIDRFLTIFADLEENIVDKDMPPGLVIKSIRTAYELPETGEPPYGFGGKDPEARSDGGMEKNTGKPEDSGPGDQVGRPDHPGNQNEVSSADASKSQGNRPDETGRPDNPGRPDNDDDEDKGRKDPSDNPGKSKAKGK